MKEENHGEDQHPQESEGHWTPGEGDTDPQTTRAASPTPGTEQSDVDGRARRGRAGRGGGRHADSRRFRALVPQPSFRGG
jgi:hypothetical protein